MRVGLRKNPGNQLITFNSASFTHVWCSPDCLQGIPTWQKREEVRGATLKIYDDADAKMTLFTSRNKRIAVVLLKGSRREMWGEMMFLKLPAGGEAFNMCSDEGFRAEIRLFVFCSIRKIGALFNTQKADITVSAQLMMVMVMVVLMMVIMVRMVVVRMIFMVMMMMV